MEQWRMQETNTGLLYLPFQPRRVVLKAVTQLLHDIGSAADGRSPIIAVFRHLMPRPRDDKTSQRRNVKGVFTVSARADNVDGLQAGQVHANAKLQQSVLEILQLVNSYTAHKEYGYEGRQLGFIELAPGYAYQHIF